MIFQTVPVAGAAEVFSLKVGPGNYVYGVASGSNYFVFDLRQLKVVHLEDLFRFGSLVWPSLMKNPQRTLNVLLSASILKVNAENLSVEKLAEVPVPATAGLAIKDGWLYFASNAHLWRYRLLGP